LPPYADEDCAEIVKGLEWLLDEGHWEEIAQQAHEYVLANHTWAVRARQLRGIFLETFPDLKGK
jgi:spore maturation protein CgeB